MGTQPQLRHDGHVGSPRLAPGRGRLRPAAAGGAVLVALLGSAVATGFEPDDMRDALAVAFVIGAIAVVGAVVVLAIPSNRVGWLLLAAAATWGAGVGLTEAGVHGVVTSPGSVPGADYLAAVGPGLRGVGFVFAVLAVPVVFPDGRLPGPRWRWLGWCVGATAVFLLFSSLLSPTAQESRLTNWQNPIGLPARYGHVADVLGVAGVLLATIAAVGAVAGLVTRWRRDGPLVRQQLLFLTLAACPPAILLLLVIPTGGQPPWVFAIAVLPIPAAIAVATLSYGLYDLRRATNRTLVWLTLSGAVVVIYAVVVLTAAAVVPDRRSWWPPALAAVLAALLLVPLHGSIQRGVNHVVYGRWHEPYEVLAGLGERLAAAADVDRLLDATVAELTTGLDLQDVGVRGLDGAVIAGVATDGGTSVPLEAYSSTVGWLTYRPPGRPLASNEQRLLRDLAGHLGGVLHARVLHTELQRARERLVLAREEERRRLRRDLHDGVGPALAGLTLKAETAKALLPRGADAACRQLHALSEDIRSTVLDIRRVVEGLRPPALDELGLAGACTQAVTRLAAEGGVAVVIDAEDQLPVLPAAVEVAAYRIVVEAVTNIVRHASASHCSVSLTATSVALTVTVLDDGDGLDATHTGGNGLPIMRERAEELGGRMIVSNASPGVLVCARLPIAPAPARAPVAPEVSA